MSDDFSFPHPPRGIKALPWRFPILLFRLGLGRLLGNRFLLLNHVGRKTGKPRQAVLEIIHCSPELGKYTVVSGFGKRSDWYLNILQQPKVRIQVGKRTMPARARQLDPEEAGDLMVDYAKNNPGSLKALSKLMGYKIEHTPDGIRRFGKRIPVIQFTVDQNDH